MQKIYFIITSLLLTAFVMSCGNPNVDRDFTNYKWQAVELQATGSSEAVKAPGTYLLEFGGGRTFSLRLDINGCQGKYEILSESSISFLDIACTEACCDSDFAIEMRGFLQENMNYSAEGNQLVLEGDKGRISFER